MLDSQNLKKFCGSLGLYEVGIADRILRFPVENPVCPLAAGKGEERYDLNRVLPGCRSAAVILFPYKLPAVQGSNLSCYCQMPDYHPVVHGYLNKISSWLQKNYPGCKNVCIADTSPLAERMLAVQAGVGILGDNGCVINRRYGSYCFIGAVLTDLAFNTDRPVQGGCLHCGKCARACPGQCFSHKNYDYRFCKSYLTQKKGELTEAEKAVLRKTPLVFGCDVCQDVCPLNQKAENTSIPEFLQARLPFLDCSRLENLTNRQFKEKYGGYAFSWRGKKILLRNYAVLKEKFSCSYF